MAEKRFSKCVTALGDLLLIVPDSTATLYRVVHFNANGQWLCMHEPKGLAEAKKQRSGLFALHRKIRRETEARAAKRRK